MRIQRIFAYWGSNGRDHPYNRRLIQLIASGVFILGGHPVYSAANTDDINLFALPLSSLLQVKISSVSQFPETPKTAAASVTKIEREHWQLWGARNNLDAISHRPGLQVSPSILSKILSIRGFTQITSGRGILTQIDGTPVNDIIFGSSQADQEHITLGVVDNIELIAGPSSTQHGTDAFHGTLSFNTFESDKDLTELNVRLGSEDYKQLSLISSKALGAGALNIAIDGRQQQNGGQDYFNTVLNQADTRSDEFQNYTTLIKWHTLSDTRHYLKLSAYQNKNQIDETPGGGVIYGYTLRDISSSENQISLISSDYRYQYSPSLNIGLSSSYWEIQRNNLYSTGAGPSLLTHKTSRGLLKAQLTWQGEDNNRFYAAAEYSDHEIIKATADILDSNLTPLSSTNSAEDYKPRKVTSIILQGRRRTSWNKLSIEGGLRLDDYSDFGRQNSPRLGLILDFNSHHTVKLLYGESYRAPLMLELYGSLLYRGNPDLKPETLVSHELVYFYTKPTARFSLTAFENQWKQGIISSQLPNEPVYFAEYINSAKNSSNGVEFDVNWQPNAWELALSGSWITSRNETSNTDFVAFPEWMLKTELRYHANHRSLYALRLNAQGNRYEGPISEAYPNPKKLSTYLRMDAAYQRALSKSSTITLSINNLLNHSNRLPSIVNNIDGDPDDQRRIEFGLKKRW